MSAQTKVQFTWSEVLAELKQGNHDVFFIPHEDEQEGALFEKRQIPLSEITDFTTYEDFQLLGFQRDLELIDNLIAAYERGDQVPPIVLGNNHYIIDGRHRLTAQYRIGKEYIEAFIKLPFQ